VYSQGRCPDGTVAGLTSTAAQATYLG
jgi:hypothetical protein